MLLQGVTYVEAALCTHSVYENSKNGHWEPLLEPWNVSLGYQQGDNSTTTDILAEFMQINISHAVLVDGLELSNLLTAHQEAEQ